MALEVRGAGRRALIFSAAGALATALALPLAAPALAAYPDRPVTIVVPFAPGGSLDITARIIADRLRDILGQPVVIANRPGAGTAIGARAVAAAPPDGYTLLISSGSAFGFLHLLLRDFNLHLSDFAPVGGVAVYTSLFAVRPSLPVRTLPELVELARRTPGGLSFCTTGVGGINHLQLEMFRHLVQTRGGSFDVTHVPYNGVAPALTALQSDSVQACTLPYSSLVRNMDGNALRVIAVQRGRRLPGLPDAPTTGEQGFPQMDGNEQLVTMSAPGRTPPTVLQRIEQALAEAMRDPGVLRRLEEADVQPTYVNARDARQWLEDDVRKLSGVIRDANLAVRE